jgi:hypothetical protein
VGFQRASEVDGGRTVSTVVLDVGLLITAADLREPSAITGWTRLRPGGHGQCVT